MKKKQLYEGFADDFKAAKLFRNKFDIAEQRRQRKIGNFIERNNGEWFSFYDMLQEKSQWYTVFSDIMYAFSFVYTADRPLSTRIFVENCTNADISQLKHEIATFIKRKKYECNVYNVYMENANDNVAEIKNEMSGDDMPAIVLVDSINVTQDMVRTHQATEEEIGDAIDRITEEILPERGVLVYFERWPQHEDEYDDEYDDNNEFDEPSYPEGYGTGEIDFDNVNESDYSHIKSITRWAESNNESFCKAVDILSDYIMQDVDVETFSNATDIEECDGFDFQNFYSILDSESLYTHIQDQMYRITEQPYKLKSLIDKYMPRTGTIDVWESMLSDNWEEILENESPELVDSIWDLHDVSKITNKYAYGGGGFEIIRDLQLATVSAVGDKIKNAIKNQ